MKRIIEVGNLFEFAEKRLIQKLQREEINGYSLSDVIDYAIKVRKYLDKNKRLIIPKLTKKETKRNNKKSRMRFYLKTGR